MASLPSDPKPVVGRVDLAGRLITADPELERLQVEAGSRLGAPLALPQLAAIVRTVQRLRVTVSRRAVAAGKDQDIDMWVRASPEGEEVALAIEQWSARPCSGARLALVAGREPVLPGTARRWAIDEQLRIVALSESLAEIVGIDPAAAVGQPLTKLLRLEENEDGSMPLLAALASRSPFSGQRARTRNADQLLLLSGRPTIVSEQFAGFEGSAEPPETASAVPPDGMEDAHLDEVLRSPLDRIIDCAGRIVERTDGPLRNEYAVYAADISAAAHHLLSIVRSIGHEPTVEQARIDLVELTSEAVGLVESAALERDIAIAVEPVSSCIARGEARGVIQILVNLIGNAIRYSPERTAVAISFERVNGSALVHVADHGPGIAPADQQRIFERFQQGTTGGPGSGLGLAIARRLARVMEGDIRLKSEPGNGSTFTLVLPTS